jgi:hypothetical protein
MRSLACLSDLLETPAEVHEIRVAVGDGAKKKGRRL